MNADWMEERSTRVTGEVLTGFSLPLALPDGWKAQSWLRRSFWTGRPRTGTDRSHVGSEALGSSRPGWSCVCFHFPPGATVLPSRPFRTLSPLSWLLEDPSQAPRADLEGLVALQPQACVPSL